MAGKAFFRLSAAWVCSRCTLWPEYVVTGTAFDGDVCDVCGRQVVDGAWTRVGNLLLMAAAIAEKGGRHGP